MGGFYDLFRNIENCIVKNSFKKYEINNILNFENNILRKRRTSNSNRAIVLIELSNNYVNNINNLGKFDQEIKIDLEKEIGYRFLIY